MFNKVGKTCAKRHRIKIEVYTVRSACAAQSFGLPPTPTAPPPPLVTIPPQVHDNRAEIARLWLPLLLTSAITVPASLLAAAALTSCLALDGALALAMVSCPPFLAPAISPGPHHLCLRCRCSRPLPRAFARRTGH